MRNISFVHRLTLIIRLAKGKRSFIAFFNLIPAPARSLAATMAFSLMRQELLFINNLRLRCNVNFDLLAKLSNDKFFANLSLYAEELAKYPEGTEGHDDALAMFEGVLIQFVVATQNLSEQQAEEFITPETLQQFAERLQYLR